MSREKQFVEKLTKWLEREKESSPCKNIKCTECKYTNKCFEGEMAFKVEIDNIINIANQLAEEDKEFCEWSYHRTIDNDRMYKTSCYHEFEKSFVKKYKFCPYCGKPISLKEKN